MFQFPYQKAPKYADLETIYAQCSGPGALRLTEYLAEKMGVASGAMLLDVGCNRGYQSCFLAKEYGAFVTAIDPWDDRMDGRPMIEHARENAAAWGVERSLLAINTGVPDTGIASESFDFAYSTTALEMLRVMNGDEGYLAALQEVLRLLKPGGVFGLGEPMHLDAPIPDDLLPYVSQNEYPWKDCFTTLRATVEAVENAGFEIVLAEYSADARAWWLEYAANDPFCKQDPNGDPKTLEVDQGRWTSFGCIVARKPL